MIKYGILCSLLASFSVYYFLSKDVQNLCDIEECPNCYGNDFCEKVKNGEVTLRYYSISAVVSNVISVKNVYFASYRGVDVVLKKLAHNSEIIDFNNGKFINDNLKICDNRTRVLFLEKFQHKFPKNLQTILHVNAEPLLLELFPKHKNFPVPKLFGYCGRAVFVEDCGVSLNNIENYDWYDRAYIAYQLLLAAEKFTFDHEHFRLYLTDISPDNIAVDKNLSVSFVDLENAVVLRKYNKFSKIHITHHFEENSYGFSEDDLCSHSLSDHNIYSICWLILSQNAPWPMMNGGLLHSPPLEVISNYKILSNKIEKCVKSRRVRFSISGEIKNQLKDIIVLINRYNIS